MKHNKVSEAFERLAAAERAFAQQQFLAPVLPSRPIRVRIAGVVQHLRLVGRHAGWGVWQASRRRPNHEARWVRAADAVERQAYLDLLPAVRLVLCRRTGTGWQGLGAGSADGRVGTGLVPVQLAEAVQVFDTVRCRFDGVLVWYDQPDARRDPRAAAYLREQLAALTEPDALTLPGLVAAERDAYQIAWAQAMAADVENKKDREEERIKAALARAGAVYQGYIDRGDTYTIEYAVDGQRHRSVVNKTDLTVEAAGICLDGTDKLFDLQSLVGVVRRGQRERRIVRLGDNARLGDSSDLDHDYDDEDYD